MKIGIDARLTYYRDGGISTYIRRLIQALEQVDQVNKYTLGYSRKDTQRLSTRFQAASLWTPAHHKIERLALSVETAWRGFDLWHSPDFIPPYYAAKRHVITVHDLTFLHYPQYLTAEGRAYYNAQIEAACRRADQILGVSHATKNDLITMLGVPEAKITVQPHGVDESYQPLDSATVQKGLQDLGLPTGYLLHVGTLEPRKNIVGLLQAYRILLKKMRNVPPVLLVGRRGWLFEESEKEIAALKLGSKLIWREDISDAQLPLIYNGASLLVTPSFYEGFGMPALEAMACGTIPIVSERSSLPEVVGQVGLLVNPESPDSIAAALFYALSDKSWREKMRQAALERAKQFTWERSAQIALTTYTSLA